MKEGKCENESACPDDGWFKEPTPKKCLKCHGLCKLCDGILDNNCLKCYDSRFLHSKTCVVSCPETFFLDNT